MFVPVYQTRRHLLVFANEALATEISLIGSIKHFLLPNYTDLTSGMGQTALQNIGVRF